MSTTNSRTFTEMEHQIKANLRVLYPIASFHQVAGLEIVFHRSVGMEADGGLNKLSAKIIDPETKQVWLEGPAYHECSTFFNDFTALSYLLDESARGVNAILDQIRLAPK